MYDFGAVYTIPIGWEGGKILMYWNKSKMGLNKNSNWNVDEKISQLKKIIVAAWTNSPLQLLTTYYYEV